MSRKLRVPISPLRAGTVELDRATSRYVVGSHRLRRGAGFLAFDPESRQEADAEVVKADRNHATCELGEPRPACAVSPLLVTLIQAIARGAKLDRVVGDATALGVRRIVVVASARTIAGANRMDDERLRRWRRIAVQAARQCGRGDVPDIEGARTFEAALRVAATAGDRFLLDHDADRRFSSELDDRAWPSSRPLALAVGPEGGFSRDEVVAAEAAGFLRVTLGPFVLRTETAAAAALAVLASRVGLV